MTIQAICPRAARARTLPGAWVAFCAAFLAARATLACAVCFTATEENRIAFIATTVFLTFLPLLIIGGVIWWLREKVRAHNALNDEAPGERS